MTAYSLDDQTGGRPPEEVAAVIAAGHPPEAEGVWLIDFDATISPFGYMFSFVKPFPGAAEFTRMLKGQGYTVGIFTSRLSPLWLNAVGHTAEQHIEYITAYGKQYGIEFDFITSEKRPALGYIDDKAIAFNGDWEEIYNLFRDKGWLK